MMSNLFPPTTPINSTNPGTVFGFGTWELWGSGRVPVCVNTSDSGGVVSLQMRHNGTQWILEVCSIINGQKYHMHFIPDSGLQSGW